MSEWQLFRSKRVVLDEGVQEASIYVTPEGRIHRIVTASDRAAGRADAPYLPQGATIVDVGDLVLMPGLVDSHVHLNEPGRVEWEGFWTGTRAAAAGGVTTLVEMPLNSRPPTTTKDNLQEKLEASGGKLHVDVALWGGVVPDNKGELRAMVDAGVVGFKCFLCPSGEESFPNVDWTRVESAMQELQGTDAVFAFHAECVLPKEDENGPGLPTEYKTYLRTRPPEMEVRAIQKIIELCDKYKVRCHVVHLSAADALPFIHKAKQAGLPLTVETCFHYLTLNAEAIPDKATQYKCCPPIREIQNRERLWAALTSGEIDFVVSDHSPSTPDVKCFDEGDFLRAWGGIPSLQLGLPLFWTQARKRGFCLLDAARFLCKGAAQMCHLDNRKGSIAEGKDADFVIWDPDVSFTVTKSIIEFKNKTTPYLGMQLDGMVMRTVVRGKTVYEHGHPFPLPEGSIILKQ
ncbi:allantoinase [Schistocerca nitens]|uniref:allantoinase n=1 Tax=Schistocerca nitens TaxID=7011 RepID=UPI0021196652|nr:allantoinase [Schistocerca nitens]